MDMSNILLEIDKLNSRKEKELEENKQVEKKFTKEERVDLLEDITGLKKTKTKGLETY